MTTKRDRAPRRPAYEHQIESWWLACPARQADAEDWISPYDWQPYRGPYRSKVVERVCDLEHTGPQTRLGTRLLRWWGERPIPPPPEDQQHPSPVVEVALLVPQAEGAAARYREPPTPGRFRMGRAYRQGHWGLA